MNNYELSQELKERGLGDGSVGLLDGTNIPIVSGLSLPELIEACGGKFALFGPGCHLTRIDETELGNVFHGEETLKDTWLARVDDSGNDEGLEGQGKTPEEAVARLWLALNKK